MRKASALLSVLFAILLVLGATAVPAFADEGKDESGQNEESQDSENKDESEKNDESAKNEAEGDRESDKNEADGDAESAKNEKSGDRESDRNGGGDDGGSTASGSGSGNGSGSSNQTGQGHVEVDPASAEGSCPGGTAFKIDNLRSNGTFGPITISNFTMTSFSWSSTQNVTAVLVKDGGGVKSNAGGTSGSASSFGQDISHVIFCLSGDVVAGGQVDQDEDKVCDADDNMANGIQECNKGDDTDSPIEDEVLGDTLTNEDDEVAAAPAARGPSDEVAGETLPFTGAQLAGLVALALMLMGGGGLFLLRRK